MFLYCSGILLIAEVISRFKKIGSFVRKLRKLGFALENQVLLWCDVDEGILLNICTVSKLLNMAELPLQLYLCTKYMVTTICTFCQ